MDAHAHKVKFMRLISFYGSESVFRSICHQSTLWFELPSFLRLEWHLLLQSSDVPFLITQRATSHDLVGEPFCTHHDHTGLIWLVDKTQFFDDFFVLVFPEF